MSTTAASVGAAHDDVACWCCGQRCPDGSVVRLGDHPEVAVCLRCAHFLHQQARNREDARRPSIASRLRGGVRSGRRLVIQYGWHRKLIIGPGLRWVGRYLP